MAWRPKYKQLCAICRKNHVLIITRNQFPICTSCSMRQISKPIEDEKFKKLFDIDEKLYEESSFLRSIKSNYLRFGSLSEKQVEVFKRVAEELKSGAKSKKPAEIPGKEPLSEVKKDGDANEKGKKAKQPGRRKTTAAGKT